MQFSFRNALINLLFQPCRGHRVLNEVFELDFESGPVEVANRAP